MIFRSYLSGIRGNFISTLETERGVDGRASCYRVRSVHDLCTVTNNLRTSMFSEPFTFLVDEGKEVVSNEGVESTIRVFVVLPQFVTRGRHIMWT